MCEPKVIRHDDGYNIKFFDQKKNLILELMYQTEPPHGDFLYSLNLNNRTLSFKGKTRLFWSRNIVFSDCGKLLAITEYTNKVAQHVIIDLVNFTEIRKSNFVHFTKIEDDKVYYCDWIINNNSNVTHSDEKFYDMSSFPKWSELEFTSKIEDGTIEWIKA